MIRSWTETSVSYWDVSGSFDRLFGRSFVFLLFLLNSSQRVLTLMVIAESEFLSRALITLGCLFVLIFARGARPRSNQIFSSVQTIRLAMDMFCGF